MFQHTKHLVTSYVAALLTYRIQIDNVEYSEAHDYYYYYITIILLYIIILLSYNLHVNLLIIL
jgi:hypothetical protein